MNLHLPLVASMGEPAGIGPDIALLARAAASDGDIPVFAVVGCARTLRDRTASLPAALRVNILPISSMAEAATAFAQGLPVIDRPATAAVTAGMPSQANAGAVINWIDEAVALVLSGDARGLVTCPIQKETLYGAGFAHQGHTDYLAHLAHAAGHAAEPVMMLSAGEFRTVPLTVHVRLADVPGLVTADAIIAQAQIIDRDLKQFFGLARPRIAVAGLNPHAGEGGSIGTEDRDVVAPAIAALRGDGIDAFGPLPADTMFHEEARAGYDVALCMYHDQALIPIKTVGFHIGVNTTLGLPFVRTSPDHGTALSLAGTGAANPSSFIAALQMARTMAGRTPA